MQYIIFIFLNSVVLGWNYNWNTAQKAIYSSKSYLARWRGIFRARNDDILGRWEPKTSYRDVKILNCLQSNSFNLHSPTNSKRIGPVKILPPSYEKNYRPIIPFLLLLSAGYNVIYTFSVTLGKKIPCYRVRERGGG